MVTTSWRAEWKAISARIEGLVRSGEFFFRSATNKTNYLSNATRYLTSRCDELDCYLKSYLDTYASVLPETAKNCLDEFLSLHRPGSGAGANVNAPQQRLMILSDFRSRLEFLLAGAQDQIRLTAERAFEHLQRCIVADETYKEKWIKAFEDTKTSEIKCEGLGGVHLLWHGIWAFKVSAEGERTDLVMGNRIDNPSKSKVEESAIGMILTEWKIARKASEVEASFEDSKKCVEGKTQANRYSCGVLGGVELVDTRYIVVVTRNRARASDRTTREGDVTYRFINIDVELYTPSEEAAKRRPDS
ncbi:MAG: hypothetical protein Q7T82_09185 [Armatimonadota bacterium]|nr:hypothetical protein [Armatimonadota bacterium]